MEIVWQHGYGKQHLNVYGMSAATELVKKAIDLKFKTIRVSKDTPNRIMKRIQTAVDKAVAKGHTIELKKVG